MQVTSLEPAPRRLIVGISGASGVMYGVRMLQLLRNAGVETHLVMSKTAEITFAYETALKIADVKALAHTHHRIDDMAASISSGSFRTTGMIIAPCSIRSMSEIATGVTTTLLTRAADVTLKDRRRLVLMVRETPLHTGHLRTMTALSEMGAIIAPPVPAFYAKPQSLDEMIDHSLGRLLDLFGLDTGTVRRAWLSTSSASGRISALGRVAATVMPGSTTGSGTRVACPQVTRSRAKMRSRLRTASGSTAWPRRTSSGRRCGRSSHRSSCRRSTTRASRPAPQLTEM